MFFLRAYLFSSLLFLYPFISSPSAPLPFHHHLLFFLHSSPQSTLISPSLSPFSLLPPFPFHVFISHSHLSLSLPSFLSSSLPFHFHLPYSLPSSLSVSSFTSPSPPLPSSHPLSLVPPDKQEPTSSSLPRALPTLSFLPPWLSTGHHLISLTHANGLVLFYRLLHFQMSEFQVFRSLIGFRCTAQPFAELYIKKKGINR